MVKLYDTIIIGAGIAGLTAAIYASRERRKFEIISADFGGQFLESGEVYNYPGIVETTGINFNSIMQEQMRFNNIKIKEERVKRKSLNLILYLLKELIIFLELFLIQK